MANIPDGIAGLGIVVPALTGLGGYWLAGRNEEARDRRQAEREATTRREERGAVLRERMHDFQRDLLLQLQDVLQRSVRMQARVIMHDKDTLRTQGKLDRLPGDLDQDEYNIGVELKHLVERVLDDGLRGALTAYRTYTSSLSVLFVQINGLPTTAAIARLDTALMEMTTQYEAVNEWLGALLRAELGRVEPDS